MKLFQTNIEEVIELPELPESRNGVVDLEVADIIDHPVGQVVRGFIYNDTKRKQFGDGDFIRTSIVRGIVSYQDELYVITLNTTYRVIGWAAKEQGE